MLNPILHLLRKIELELTCPSCLIVLRQPTMLSCRHIVCRHCITSKTNGKYECPICKKTFVLTDLISLTEMMNIVNIFKNMDYDMVCAVQKLAHSGITMKSPEKGSTSSINVTINEPKEGLVNSRTSKGTYYIPSLDDNNEFNHDPTMDHGSGSSVLKFPKRQAEAESFVSKDHNSNVSPIFISPSEKYDDGRRVKEEKSNNNRSDIDPKPHDNNGHDYAQVSLICAFCRLSTITEYMGPMLHYANEKPAGPEEIHKSNVMHFHEKCFEWAPQAYFEGEIAKNYKIELARSSQIICENCGKKGAALGCYYEHCPRSYHFPCAVQLPNCRWDYIEYNFLCPSHSSCKFSNEIINFKWANKGKRALRLRDKSREKIKTKANIMPSQIGNLNSSTQACEELWISEPGICSKWVLCGSNLSAEEMELLKKFASLSGASYTGKWNPTVTHVIASTDENAACSRTLQVILGILHGNWVLSLEWINASMEAMSPIFEEAYEIRRDSCGSYDGPKKGRIRAMRKAPKVFTGLSFYLCNQFGPSNRAFLEEVIPASGATIIEDSDLAIQGPAFKISSKGSSFLVYNEEPPQGSSANVEEIIGRRCDETIAVQNKTGFKMIGHIRLLDHLASCSSKSDLQNDAVGSQ